ncbi:MAG: hypothetical protein QOC56_813 [Alphaproteobacteria bacterium]|jgi:hypothetical protein|nr:hypothetical protein [Alphaproteobacteria bacterium]
MTLNSFNNSLKTRAATARVLLAVLSLFALTGCISSTGPILGDAKAILGERIQLHVFDPPKDGARAHTVVAFEWNGSRYLPRGGAGDFNDFTVHPYEGRDLIVQTQGIRAPHPTEYALARRLAEGVYLIIPVNEEDADEATRDRFCSRTQDASCRIATPEQLFVFARATAAKDEDTGGIAVIVPAARR